MAYAGESEVLKKKAKWHTDRAGSRLPASMEKAAQLHYRAELLKVPNAGMPTGPLAKGTRVREMGGRSVEPEFKNKSGRPDPKEFAWR